MSKVSINMSLKDSSNNKSAKSYSYLNPAATDNELYAFAQAIANVTKDTVESVSRIETSTLENITITPVIFNNEWANQNMTKVNDHKYTTVVNGNSVFGGHFTVGGVTIPNLADKITWQIYMPIIDGQGITGNLQLMSDEDKHNMGVYLTDKFVGSKYTFTLPAGQIESDGTVYYYEAYSIEIEVI